MQRGIPEIQINVNKTDMLLMILDFLKNNKLFHSMIILEGETGLNYQTYPKEIQVIRQVILGGEFEEAYKILEVLRNQSKFPYKNSLLTIKKQHFFELIENSNPENADLLLNISKELEGLTTKQEYKELCFFLTLQNISDHPDYSNWNIFQGRYYCFEELLPSLESIFVSKDDKKGNIKPNRLEELMKYIIQKEIQDKSDFLNKIRDNKNHVSLIDNTINNNTMNAFSKKYNININFVDQPKISQKRNDILYSSMEIKNKNNLLSTATDLNIFGIQSMYIDHNFNPVQQIQNYHKENNITHLNQPIDDNFNHSNNPPNLNNEDNRMQDLGRRSISSYKSGYDEITYPQNINQNLSQSKAVQNMNNSKAPEFEYKSEQRKQTNENEKNINSNYSLKESHKKYLETGEEEKGITIPNKSDMQSGRRASKDFYNTSKTLNTYGSNISRTYYQEKDFDEMIEIAQIIDTQPIRTASFDPDGQYFVIGTNSKSLKVYSLKALFSAEEQSSYEMKNVDLIFEKANHHFGSIYSVDWSNTGKFIASGSNDKLVKIISVPDFYNQSQILELKLTGHKGIIRSLSFNNDDTYLYSAATDCLIKVWDVNEGVELRTLDGHTDAIYCLQVSGDAQYCVSVGMDKTIKLWDLRAHKCTLSIPNNGYSEMNYISLSENLKNYSLNSMISQSKNVGQKNTQNNKGSKLAAISHTDGLVTIWDLKTTKVIEEIRMHDADCRSVEFDSTSNYLVTSSFDSTVGIYDIGQHVEKNKLTYHTDRVVLAKWHPIYPIILSTSADKTARLCVSQKFLDSQFKK